MARKIRVVVAKPGCAGTCSTAAPRSRSQRSAPSIVENFEVFDFELADQELAAIDALDTGVRGGPEPDSITLEAYGIDIPEA